MGQEFIINSEAIESKINQLLPSQGGFGAGVDFSASTMVIPIVDLTETAEGSSVRLDLQKAVDNATTRSIASNGTTVAITTTGFFQINVESVLSSGGQNTIDIFDGTTANIIREYGSFSALQRYSDDNFIVFLSAGLSLRLNCSNSASQIVIFSRQIADITGNLVNPLLFTS